MNNGLSSYVDLVLCGHTHKQEIGVEQNVYYVQNYANTQSFADIKLTYDFDNHKVSKTTVKHLSAYDILNNAKEIDPTIESIIESYNNQCDTAANEVLANNVTDEFSSSGYAERVMTKAIMSEALSAGYSDVTVSCVNKARHSLADESWTYADLYQAFPFDNTVYIAEITGNEFLRQVANNSYNYICKNPSFTDTTINRNETYKIAVIDYIYFHTNEERDYDYFYQTGGTSKVTLEKNYREILRDWLKEHGYNNGKELTPSDFSSSNWEFNNSYDY